MKKNTFKERSFITNVTISLKFDNDKQENSQAYLIVQQRDKKSFKKLNEKLGQYVMITSKDSCSIFGYVEAKGKELDGEDFVRIKILKSFNVQYM